MPISGEALQILSCIVCTLITGTQIVDQQVILYWITSDCGCRYFIISHGRFERLKRSRAGFCYCKIYQFQPFFQRQPISTAPAGNSAISFLSSGSPQAWLIPIHTRPTAETSDSPILRYLTFWFLYFIINQELNGFRIIMRKKQAVFRIQPTYRFHFSGR